MNVLYVVPKCDVCGAVDESVDWCGDCGCCVAHCRGFEDCVDPMARDCEGCGADAGHECLPSCLSRVTDGAA